MKYIVEQREDGKWWVCDDEGGSYGPFDTEAQAFEEVRDLQVEQP